MVGKLDCARTSNRHHRGGVNYCRSQFPQNVPGAVYLCGAGSTRYQGQQGGPVWMWAPSCRDQRQSAYTPITTTATRTTTTTNYYHHLHHPPPPPHTHTHRALTQPTRPSSPTCYTNHPPHFIPTISPTPHTHISSIHSHPHPHPALDKLTFQMI